MLAKNNSVVELIGNRLIARAKILEKVMVTMEDQIKIEDDKLYIIPQGLDKLWSFENQLVIPLDHILGATIDQDILKTRKGLRGPGLGLPNKWSGTWTLHGVKSFWNITRQELPLVIQLKDEYYSQIVIGVDEPRKWTGRLNSPVNP